MFRRLFAFAVLAAAQATADPAVIEDVQAEKRGTGWYFAVTLSHADTGWDDYADGWRIVDPATWKVYGTRTLHHPHVDEQPFTRSLSGIQIPDDVDVVLIEERTSPTGWIAVNPTEAYRGDPEPSIFAMRNSRVFALRPTDLCSAPSWIDSRTRVPAPLETGLLSCQAGPDRRIISPPEPPRPLPVAKTRPLRGFPLDRLQFR